MNSRKMYLLTLEEQERLRLRRKKWRIQQEYDKKHEERKLKMIEEYERKRAEVINKQNSMYKRRSKSSSPRQRKDSSLDYGWMFASISTDFHKMCLPTLEEQERLRLKRKEWRIQQEYNKKYEEQKLKMIEEYERKRAEVINKQKSMYKRRSKSSSPRQREDNSLDYGYSKKWMFASITIDFHKMCLPILEEQERLRLRRKEWRIQQEYDKKHEERKLKMIEEYERKRAEVINKQKSMYLQKPKQEQ